MDKRQKILIVDDAKLNRDILKEILGDTYNYLEAENGNQAIQMIYVLFSLDVAAMGEGIDDAVAFSGSCICRG